MLHSSEKWFPNLFSVNHFTISEPKILWSNTWYKRKCFYTLCNSISKNMHQIHEFIQCMISGLFWTTSTIQIISSPTIMELFKLLPFLIFYILLKNNESTSQGLKVPFQKIKLKSKQTSRQGQGPVLGNAAAPPSLYFLEGHFGLRSESSS